MPPSPPRKPPAHQYAPRPTAIPLEEVLSRIAAAGSPQDLEAVVRTARAHYAGSMMEQLENVAAERARYLLECLGRDADA